jgi:chromosome segregation ATPase
MDLMPDATLPAQTEAPPATKKTLKPDIQVDAVPEPRPFPILSVTLGVLCVLLLAGFSFRTIQLSSSTDTGIQTQNRLDQLQATASEMQAHLDADKVEMAKVQKQADDAAAQSTADKADTDAAKAATAAIQTELDKVRVISTGYQTQMEEAKVASLKHQGEVEVAKAETQVAQDLAAKARADLAASQAQVSDLSTRNTDLQAALDADQKTIDKLRATH